MSTLADVAAAKRALTDAEKHLKRVVADAVAGGVPVAKVAREARTTRPTVYAWIKQAEEG